MLYRGAAAGKADRVEDARMVQFGIHGSVWVGGWTRQDAETMIGSAGRLGYDRVEIPVFDPDSFDVAHTRGLLEQHGLAAGMSLGLAVDQDVSITDSATVARGAAHLQKVLALNAAIGGDYFCGVIYGALNKYGSPVDPKGRANSVSVIRELAREARKVGIAIGLEAVNRYETNMLNTGGQTLRFIDEVGEDNVFVHLDSYHMNIEEGDGAGAIELCGERLGYFHVNESHRGYLGTGSIAFTPMFRALARIGYKRPIAFEAFSTAVTNPVLSGMVAVWRDLWQDSDDLAAHALAYMKREMQDALRAEDIVAHR